MKAGDTVRYVIHEDGVQVLRTPSVSELADMLTRKGQEIVSLDAMQSFRALTKVGNDTVSPVPYDVRYWNVMGHSTVEKLPAAK